MTDSLDPPGGRTRRLAAVWFADIRGYTALSSKDEEAALRVVDVFQALVREHVEAHGGRVVKFIGDAALTVFDSTDAALKAALHLEKAFAGDATVKRHRVALRVGVHLGEVVEADDGDVYGDGVNTASRVESAAEPGQVAVTDAVYQQIKNRKDFHHWPLGERELKGLAEPVPLYEVSLEPPAPGRRPAPPKTSDPRSARLYRRATALGIGASVIAFGFLTVSVASKALPDLPQAQSDTSAREPGQPPSRPAEASTDLAGTGTGEAPVAGDEASEHEGLAVDAASASASASGSTEPEVDVVGSAQPGAVEPDDPAPETRSPPPPAPRRAVWTADASVDPIEGSALSALEIALPSGVRVAFRCVGRAEELVVRWPAPLVSPEVTMRAGEARATTERWTLSADSTATTYRGDARRVQRDWARADVVALRAEGRAGPVTAVVPLDGFIDGLDALAAGCR